MSTYLIDCSKKCIIYGSTYTLYGDLSESSLKDIGFGFKEDFKDAHEAMDAAWKKLLKPVRTLISGAVSGIPILKNMNVGSESNDVRADIIEAYVLLKTFLTNGSDTADIAKTMSQWSVVYTKTPPLRKQPPILTLALSGITVEFAYGKANVFDAYQEVYQPIQLLKSKIFPAKVGAKNATYESFASSIPFEQQVFPQLLAELLQTGSTEMSEVLTDVKDLAKTVKNSYNVDKYKTLVENKCDVYDSDNYVLVDEKAEKNFDEYYSEALSALTTSGLDAANILGAKTNYQTTKEVNDKSKTAWSVQSLAQTVKTALLQKLEDTDSAKGLTVTTSGSKFPTVVISEDTDSSSSDAGGSTKLETALTSLVNIVPDINGNVLDQLNNAAKDSAESIYLGFPPKYVTSYDDVVATCATNKAKIKVYGIITEADVKFDFSRVDEAGWPMSGKITIKNIWGINGPASALNLDTRGGVGGNAYARNYEDSNNNGVMAE